MSGQVVECIHVQISLESKVSVAIDDKEYIVARKVECVGYGGTHMSVEWDDEETGRYGKDSCDRDGSEYMMFMPAHGQQYGT